MQNVNKALDVLGIIAAWLLSIVLVVMLIVTPMVFSSLSLLEPQTLTKAITGALTGSAAPSQNNTGDDAASAKSWGVSRLSETTGDTATPPSDDSAQLGTEILKGFLGDDLAGIDQDGLNKILSSNVAKEILGAYTNDIANALYGNSAEAQFNAQNFKDIINKNMDEIVGILKDISPEMTDADVEKIKNDILAAVDEGADKVVQSLPKPEEIKTQIAEESPELEVVFDILAQKNTIKLVVIGVIVLLSALIFVCRLNGFRGFRWLAAILFVGTGFNALVSGALLVGSSALQSMLTAQPLLTGLVGAFLSSFTTGMLIRTGVMLVSAVGLLLAFIFIKKARRKASAEI